MGIPQLNRVQPERSVGDRGRTRTCNFRPLRPVWRTAPPPYIARKPLALLERQSARETAPQRLPQRKARDQAAEAPSPDLLDADDGAGRDITGFLLLARDIQHDEVAVPRRLGIDSDIS